MSPSRLEQSKVLNYQNLDQDCQALWRDLVQDIQAEMPLVTRIDSLNTQSAAYQARAKHIKSPLRALKRTGPSLNFNPKLSAPKASQLRPFVLGGLFLSALSLGGYELAERRQAPPPQVRKVMYQNAQSKVAAFRKEVAQGNHYIVRNQRPIEYTTRSGDTVDKLSKKFHLSPNTIIKNNDSKKLLSKGMKPGTRLTILPVDGIAHPIEANETIAEISKRYDVGVNEIIETNHIQDPHMIVEKQSLIIPNATELKRRPQMKPRKSHSGRLSSVKVASGRKLTWPTNGVVTSNFGWRWFRPHNGMDIAAPIGTPIRSAKSGRVVYSGWMSGYGYAVDVDHGKGVKTRYAHASALHVKTGQYVQRGQLIASMGSTGRSTGSHLHFEVHVAGKPVDPRSYF